MASAPSRPGDAEDGVGPKRPRHLEFASAGVYEHARDESSPDFNLCHVCGVHVPVAVWQAHMNICSLPLQSGASAGSFSRSSAPPGIGACVQRPARAQRPLPRATPAAQQRRPAFVYVAPAGAASSSGPADQPLREESPGTDDSSSREDSPSRDKPEEPSGEARFSLKNSDRVNENMLRLLDARMRNPQADPVARLGADDFGYLEHAIDAGLSDPELRNLMLTERHKDATAAARRAQGPRGDTTRAGGPRTLTIKAMADVNRVCNERLDPFGLRMQPHTITGASTGDTYTFWAIGIRQLFTYLYEDLALSLEYDFTPTFNPATADSEHTYSGVTSSQCYHRAVAKAPSGAVVFSVDIFSDGTCRPSSGAKYHPLLVLVNPPPPKSRHKSHNIFQLGLAPLVLTAKLRTDPRLVGARLAGLDPRPHRRLRDGATLSASSPPSLALQPSSPPALQPSSPPALQPSTHRASHNCSVKSGAHHIEIRARQAGAEATSKLTSRQSASASAEASTR